MATDSVCSQLGSHTFPLGSSPKIMINPGYVQSQILGEENMVQSQGPQVQSSYISWLAKIRLLPNQAKVHESFVHV